MFLSITAATRPNDSTLTVVIDNNTGYPQSSYCVDELRGKIMQSHFSVSVTSFNKHLNAHLLEAHFYHFSVYYYSIAMAQQFLPTMQSPRKETCRSLFTPPNLCYSLVSTLNNGEAVNNPRKVCRVN